MQVWSSPDAQPPPTSTEHQHSTSTSTAPAEHQQLPRPNFRGNSAANFNWRAAECWIERPGAPCPDKNIHIRSQIWKEMKEEKRKSRHLLPLCATVGRTQVPGTKAWPAAIIPDCDHLRPPSKSQITGFQRSCESYIDLGA